jgi:hypothetical protein
VQVHPSAVMSQQSLYIWYSNYSRADGSMLSSQSKHQYTYSIHLNSQSRDMAHPARFQILIALHARQTVSYWRCYFEVSEEDSGCGCDRSTEMREYRCWVHLYSEQTGNLVILAQTKLEMQPFLLTMIPNGCPRKI